MHDRTRDRGCARAAPVNGRRVSHARAASMSESLSQRHRSALAFDFGTRRVGVASGNTVLRHGHRRCVP